MPLTRTHFLKRAVFVGSERVAFMFGVVSSTGMQWAVSVQRESFESKMLLWLVASLLKTALPIERGAVPTM